MRQQIIDQLTSQQLPNQVGWRVFFLGKLIVMNSGKYSWKEKHHAKNALIHSLKDTLQNYRTTRDNNQQLHDSLEKMILDGDIEFRYFEPKTK